MIAFLKGTILAKETTSIILEVNNIGYQIFLSERFLKELLEIGKEAEIYTYQHVREDNISLFGFKNLEERKLFLTLNSVSGIGPKAALNFLSTYPVNQLVRAIGQGDITTMSRVPGVGKRTAEKVVVELKDKVWKLFPGIKTTESQGAAGVFAKDHGMLESGFRSEIEQALKSLGYGSKEIEQTISKNLEKLMEAGNVETAIKMILKNI